LADRRGEGRLLDAVVLAAEPTLVDQVRAPVPAGSELAAEEDLRLDRVEAVVVLVVEGVFEVEGRVAPDLVPVGERVADLRRVARPLEGRVRAVARVELVHVEVELEAVVESELELLRETLLARHARFLRVPELHPLLELHAARRRLQVDTRGGEAPKRRPLR